MVDGARLDTGSENKSVRTCHHAKLLSAVALMALGAAIASALSATIPKTNPRRWVVPMMS